MLGLPMLGGRDFTEVELMPGSSESVAIIDDGLARRLWPDEPALDRRIQFLATPESEASEPLRVVGVVPTVNHSLGNPRPIPHVYVPLGQHYASAMTVQLRVADEAAARALLPTVGRVIRAVDERAPIVRLDTWRDHVDASIDMWIYRAGAAAFGVFAGIALLLAVVGVYGVKSYVLSRRTREFGIRIAVGAHPRALRWQVLREGSATATAGLVIGVLLAVGVGRLLEGLLYGVDAFAPLVFVGAPLILLTSSLLASYLPARRATDIDPTDALRAE